MSGDWGRLSWREVESVDDVRSAWSALVGCGGRAGTVDRTATFYDFARASGRYGTLHLFMLTDLHGAIRAIVPVAEGRIDLPFHVGEEVIHRFRVKGLRILGGDALMPDEPHAIEALVSLLERRFPAARAIAIDHMPSAGDSWRTIAESRAIGDYGFVYVPGGFRDCHVIALPGTLDDYAATMTKKRRYNLTRQHRLLEEEVGAPVTLQRIEGVADLPLLFRALEQFDAWRDRTVMTREQYRLAARFGLTQCFVLTAGERILGMVIGARAGQTFHVQKLSRDASLDRFSVGTALWHLIMQTMIADDRFSRIDMGYGSPGAPYRGTNEIEPRGNVLLLRKSVGNRLQVTVHSAYDGMKRVAKAARARSKQVTARAA